MSKILVRVFAKKILTYNHKSAHRIDRYASVIPTLKQIKLIAFI